jgi:hypothetical protein
MAQEARSQGKEVNLKDKNLTLVSCRSLGACSPGRSFLEMVKVVHQGIKTRTKEP